MKERRRDCGHGRGESLVRILLDLAVWWTNPAIAVPATSSTRHGLPMAFGLEAVGDLRTAEP